MNRGAARGLSVLDPISIQSISDKKRVIFFSMSWDVMILRADGYRSLNDLPKDFKLPALGSADQIKEKLKKHYPTLELSEPKSMNLTSGPYNYVEGTYKDKTEGYVIEFSIHLDQEDPDSISLKVFGGGSVIWKIVELCRENGWKAIDTSVGDFMDLENPSSKGWEDFQAYRDQVIKKK